MSIRRAVPVLLLSLLATGCANNTASPSAASAPPVASVATGPSAAGPSSTAGGETTGGETISGTVSSGVEPNCLLLQDDKGSHLLVFDDAALRASAKAGDKVTLVGRSEPAMMSTCQQGVPFVVTAVRPG